MNRQQVVFIDQGAEFWPSGWMVPACIALGLTDVALIAYVLFMAFKGH